MKTVNIGILGLGTVGGGTYEILKMNRALIEKRINREIKVVKVLEKNQERLKALGLSDAEARSSIRVSLCESTTKESLSQFASYLVSALSMLR